MSLHRNDWLLCVKLKRAKVRKDLEVTNCDLKPLRDLALVAIPRLVQLERVNPEALKIYVDTASDVRFIRRLQRDISERGRSTESVVNQYLETVRPMHKQFIEPTKRNADVILPHGANGPAVELITTKVMSLLRDINGS